VSSFVNQKYQKQRCIDFRHKIEVWVERDRNRQRQKKQFIKHTKSLREILQVAKREYTFEKELV